jgi:hypothetical protein
MNECGKAGYRGKNLGDQAGIFLLEDENRVRRQIVLALQHYYCYAIFGYLISLFIISLLVSKKLK